MACRLQFLIHLEGGLEAGIALAAGPVDRRTVGVGTVRVALGESLRTINGSRPIPSSPLMAWESK